MKYCHLCGAELGENVRFCSACGAAVPASRNTPTVHTPFPWEGTGRQFTPNPAEGGGVGGGVIALGVVALIFAILLPLVAYPCAIVGLVLANGELRSGKTAKTYGRTLNITALVVAGINSLAGVALRLAVLF